MIFAAGASATPAAMGSISSEQDEAQRSTTGNCLNVPDGYCAVLYDDENCAGWSFNVPTGTYDLPWRYRHGCQMAIAGYLDHMCLALRASGLWLRYATLQHLTSGNHGRKEGGIKAQRDRVTERATKAKAALHEAQEGKKEGSRHN